MSDLLLIGLADLADKCIYRVILHDADRAPAESAAGDTGA